MVAVKTVNRQLLNRRDIGENNRRDIGGNNRGDIRENNQGETEIIHGRASEIKDTGQQIRRLDRDFIQQSAFGPRQYC